MLVLEASERLQDQLLTSIAVTAVRLPKLGRLTLRALLSPHGLILERACNAQIRETPAVVTPGSNSERDGTQRLHFVTPLLRLNVSINSCATSSIDKRTPSLFS